MKRLFIPVFLVLLLGLAACGDDTEVNYLTYSGEAGVSFEYPESWVITTADSGEINFASSQDLLDASTIATGGVGTVFVTTTEFFGDDIIATLNDLVTFMTEGEAGLQMVAEAERVTINGQEAATVTMSGEDNGVSVALSATLVQQADELAFVMLMYDDSLAAEMEPIMEHVRESVMLGP